MLPYSENRIDLVINKMTKAKYNELLSLDQINDDELYYIIDDDGEQLVKGYAQEVIDATLLDYVRTEDIESLMPVEANPTIPNGVSPSQLENIKVGGVIYKVSDDSGDRMVLSTQSAQETQPQVQTRGLMRGARSLSSLSLTRAGISNITDGGRYAWHEFTFNDLIFAGYFYDPTSSFQFNKSRDFYQIGNVSMIPGQITSIVVDTTKEFNLYISDFPVAEEQTLAGLSLELIQPVLHEGNVWTYSIDSNKRYFVLKEAGTGVAYINSIDITYNPSVAADSTSVYRLKTLQIGGDTWTVEPDLSDYSTSGEISAEIQTTEEKLKYKIDDLKELLGQALNANFDAEGYYLDSGFTDDVIACYFLDPEYGNEEDILFYYVYTNEADNDAAILFTYI